MLFWPIELTSHPWILHPSVVLEALYKEYLRICIWSVLYRTGEHRGNVTETNTVVFIGSLIMDLIWVEKKLYVYGTIKGSISNFRIIFFILTHFPQNLRFPHVPWYDITQVICLSKITILSCKLALGFPNPTETGPFKKVCVCICADITVQNSSKNADDRHRWLPAYFLQGLKLAKKDWNSLFDWQRFFLLFKYVILTDRYLIVNLLG